MFQCQPESDATCRSRGFVLICGYLWMCLSVWMRKAAWIKCCQSSTYDVKESVARASFIGGCVLQTDLCMKTAFGSEQLWQVLHVCISVCVFQCETCIQGSLFTDSQLWQALRTSHTTFLTLYVWERKRERERACVVVWISMKTVLLTHTATQ